MSVWYVERSGYESLQQCVTESEAQTLLNYADKSDDEYVKVELASLSVSDVIAKEKCNDEVKSMVEKEIIQDCDYIDLHKLLEKYGEI